jgi:uncharacterized coiled-coil DUF342 family protein
MGYAAAQKAATRVIENMNAQFDELKQKATGLEQQLTDISKRVTQISDQLTEIEKAMKVVRQKVV